MTDHDETQNNHPNPELDAGLRAAFGGDTVRAPGVLATLQDSIGGCQRVLLRDTPGEGAPIVKPLARDLVGRDLNASRYQVMGEIARGGVGVIMKSRDVDLGRDVAMKVLRPDQADSPNMVRRFIEEAQISGQLQHPGILPVYELGLHDESTPYFTMKLVKGKTLSALLQERREATDDRAKFLGIFQQVCQTLAYAHAKGVIHRDLKPSNILVGPFGEVQVVDWGLAKVLAAGGLADEGRTAAPQADESLAIETVRTGSSGAESLAGSVMGTPAYMPPEQARGEIDRIDERSDVFSLGAILCEILTGEPPYAGERYTVLDRARAGNISHAETNLASCDAEAELVALARRCLQPELRERPRNAQAVADDMARFLAGLEERARELELDVARADARVKSERRARRRTLGLGLVIVALLVGLAGAGFWVQQKEADRQAQERHGVRMNSERLNRHLDEAAQLLGEAVAAPVGEKRPWALVSAASSLTNGYLDKGGIDDATRDRAEALEARYRKASLDRLIIEKIEEAVITGATHLDSESWLKMEENLRNAFRKYGIDILNADHDAIVAGIQKSDMAGHLADGLELWMGTVMHLMTMGKKLYPQEKMMGYLSVLDRADPDPFAREVRALLYSPMPSAEQIRALVKRTDFTQVRPRTLAWLASVAFRAQDPDTLHAIARKALRIYSGDFMLNFDYAFQLTFMGLHDEALIYYMRCQAIRPRSSGIWRCVGNTYRELEKYDRSVEALQYAIEIDPEHAATHIDLGKTHEAAGDPAAAAAAYERALKVQPENDAAAGALKRLHESNPELKSRPGATKGE